MISLPILKNKIIVNFNITLIGLNWYRSKDPRTPLGLAMIGAYLLDRIDFLENYSMKFFNYNIRDNLSFVVHEIIENNPKIIGIGVYVWNIKEVKDVIYALRIMGFTGKIILGGPEITYGNHKLKTEYPNVDYFVKGDGENAFLNIVLYEAGMIDTLGEGIFTKNSINFDGFATIPDSDFISPFQNKLIQNSLIGENNDKFTRWQTQRGCLYRCSYCAFPNGYNRMIEMEMERIENDLRFFASQGVKEVAVLDPIFFVHKERAKQILKLIKLICPDIRFEIQTRLEHLDDELLNMISDLNIALECGVQTLDPIVQREIKRISNRDTIKEKLEKINNYGIEFEVHLIYGLPKQTLDSLVKDYCFLSKYAKTIKLFPLNRLKGTGLDISIKDNTELQFSPIFPKEIIRTIWMDQSIILNIKKYGHSFLDNFCTYYIDNRFSKDEVTNF